MAAELERNRGDGHLTLDDVLNSAPRGYPRPRHSSGLPTPYIANQDDLADANAFRRALCIGSRRCQVCGEPLGETTAVCWRRGDALVTDGAGMHPARCWPLARSKCPELARLLVSGELEYAEVPTGELIEVWTDAARYEAGMPRAYAVPTVREHA